MNTVLGIDLGTQSVKVLFYDYKNKHTVISASCELQLIQNENGKAEQLAQWWINALLDALKQIPSEIKASVKAISVSGQQHGFVALDKSGNVIAPVKLWCDTTTEVECIEIMQKLGGEKACIEMSGNKISPGFTASKVLALKKNNPSIYERLHTILLPHDYLNYYLTGELCMEMGDASGTGFLDIQKREWSREVLQAIDAERNLQDCLPPLRQANEAIGVLTKKTAEQTGLPEKTPVAIGGGDNMLGAIGTGNLKSGRTTISLGTSGTVYTYSDKAIIDKQGNIAAFCSSTGAWLPLLCTMNCTVSSELMRNLLDIELSEFDQRLSQSPIGSQGVITLPFFNGERTPNLPKAKGSIVGLDANNVKPENILRSAIEGASFALRFGVEELQRLGAKTEEIVLTGGGANSAIWRQMIADIMGAPVRLLKNNEGAAFGAALQAYLMLNGGENYELLEQHYVFDEDLSCQPDPEAQSQYNEIYAQYRSASDAITKLYQ